MYRDLGSLELLAGVRQRAVLWSNSLEPWLAGARIPDQRGIYVWDPWLGERALKAAIHWSLLLLGLSRMEGVKAVRRELFRVLMPFYERNAPALGFVIIESCRDLILNRFTEADDDGITIVQEPISNNKPILSERSIACVAGKPIELRRGIKFKANNLPLAARRTARSGIAILRKRAFGGRFIAAVDSR